MKQNSDEDVDVDGDGDGDVGINVDNKIIDPTTNINKTSMN